MRTLLSLGLLCVIGHAEAKPLRYHVGVFNNSAQLPTQKFFSTTLHPGIDLGVSYLYRKGAKSELFQNLKLGVFYHRFSQTGIQLYTQPGYRYFIKNWYGEIMLDLGYLHSFPAVQRFVWNGSAYEKKKNFGRAQFMGGLTLGAGYDWKAVTGKDFRTFLNYQFWIQAPFVNKYVPILPNVAWHIGASFPLNFKKQNHAD